MPNVGIDDAEDEFGRQGLWSWFDASKFAYYLEIPDPNNIPMDEDDFLVHKVWEEGEQWPNVRYHLMQMGELLPAENNFIKDTLAELVLKYAEEHNKLPFRTEFSRGYKNGNVQVKYKPVDNQEFAIKIDAEDYEGDLVEFIKGLETEKENPIAAGPGQGDFTIDSIRDSSLLRSFGTSVYIKNAELVDINERRQQYNQFIQSVYLIQVKNGEVADSRKKDARTEPFEVLNAKISENLYEKSDLSVGEKISFKGSIKDHRKFGFIIQNIRKIEKEGEEE